MEQLAYEDLIIQNLIDPSIATLSRQMAQYLIENIYKGKNILITGGTQSGRTLLLNILAKHIDMNKKLYVMENKAQLTFLEHDNYSVDLSNTPAEKKTKDYFIITKGLPYHEEYQSFVLDDVPKNSYVNVYRLMLAQKQVIATFNEANNNNLINNIFQQTITTYKAQNQAQQIGITLMENIDILVHIRQYEDEFIRIKEIAEPGGYDPHRNIIVTDTVFEYVTNGNKNQDGKLIGDFIRR